MWWVAALGMACAAAAAVAVRRARETAEATAAASRRTLLDARTLDDVRALVKRVTRATDSSDAVSLRLMRLYTTFAPHAAQMERLSLLAQAHQGRHDQDEWAVATVYVLATLAICEVGGYDATTAAARAWRSAPPSPKIRPRRAISPSPVA